MSRLTTSVMPILTTSVAVALLLSTLTVSTYGVTLENLREVKELLQLVR